MKTMALGRQVIQETGSLKGNQDSKAIENAKKSKNQEFEYQEMLDAMRHEFYAVYGKKKETLSSLGDFENSRTLGGGSFGVVVLVKHIPTAEYYAMKVLDKRRIIKLKQVDHTLYEKNILAAVRFPFFVHLEYFYKDNSYLYFIMPFISGGEMFTHLRRLKRFDEPLAKFYSSQVVLGLEYLHNLDIVYRDLKPENILLDAQGYIKIADLGFCKIVRGRTWTLCGTPEYLAPEIILSKGYNKSVDWWSFGIFIYELNAGMPPFNAMDPMRLYEKIVACKYKFPPHFSGELKDLVKNILQVDLTRRYGNLKNGVYDIKNHRWFRDINWLSIYQRKVVPSYKPVVKTTGDVSNFDDQDDVNLQVAAEELFPHEFKAF
ncbi:hypothetical protein WA026_000610 [Henosepilachna vigintioctopunctata]|uniref:cAMP-dependent protein kinase n=1 Tax=Henosepilachna vigintioctopunctata TaxID=420089 RepID=A0AAW1UY56_9CUCU